MALLRYSLLRLGLLAVVFAGLWLLGARGLVWLVGAVLTAWCVSYLLLRGSRDAAALWIAHRVERARAGNRGSTPVTDRDAEAEDAEVEAVELS